MNDINLWNTFGRKYGVPGKRFSCSFVDTYVKRAKQPLRCEEVDVVESWPRVADVQYVTVVLQIRQQRFQLLRVTVGNFIRFDLHEGVHLWSDQEEIIDDQTVQNDKIANSRGWSILNQILQNNCIKRSVKPITVITSENNATKKFIGTVVPSVIGDVRAFFLSLIFFN